MKALEKFFSLFRKTVQFYTVCPIEKSYKRNMEEFLNDERLTFAVKSSNFSVGLNTDTEAFYVGVNENGKPWRMYWFYPDGKLEKSFETEGGLFELIASYNKLSIIAPEGIERRAFCTCGIEVNVTVRK